MGAPDSARAPQKPCYDAAVALLTRRSHFERELRQKLERRGYHAPDIASAVERLRAAGYLDDRRTGEEWVGLRRRRGDGPRRLVAGLAGRGVGRDTIEQLLGPPGADDEGEAAWVRELAERWLARRSPKGRGAREAAALARHLDRRGFSRRAILRVLDELQLPARELSLDDQDAG